MGFFPNRDPVPPDFVRQFKALQREVRLLSQRIDREDVPQSRRTELTFSHPGTPTTNLSAGYLIKDYSGTLTALTFTCNTPGSSDSTLKVCVNGTVEATVTIPSGENVYSQDDLMIDVDEWDRVGVQLTTIGTGLADVVVHLQLIVDQDASYN